MNILFVENRYRTAFWLEIGSLLEQQGHSVTYLIQNHSFKPKRGNCVLIPYPPKGLPDTQNPSDLTLIKSDRNINYFHHTRTGHYTYYRKYIHEYLVQSHPDVVFGECTAFHELITIDECKTIGIPYFHPSTCRFPMGRFSFYEYNTLVPFSGSEEYLKDDDALQLIDGIVHRKVKPDYMKKKKADVKSIMNRIWDLCRLSYSFYCGEKYNTPRPDVKYRIEKHKKQLIAHWDTMAVERESQMNDSSFHVLYALQMQPEANLDVWGQKYRNQLDNIQQILANTPKDVRVIVKPNPKSKYELTDELLDFVEHEPRIIPILHATPMAAVLPNIQLVVSVTGTIAIECILSDIPIVTMVRTMNNDEVSCPFLAGFEELALWIDKIRCHKYPHIDNTEKIRFINRLNATSFKGLPYETYSTKQNLLSCIDGFVSISKILAANNERKK